jgi:hypothetical protein
MSGPAPVKRVPQDPGESSSFDYLTLRHYRGSSLPKPAQKICKIYDTVRTVFLLSGMSGRKAALRRRDLDR